MITWMRKKWKEWQSYRALVRQVDPQNFQRMAREIRELAQLAAHVCPDSADIRMQISNIQHEMDRLDEMASQPEFRRLSTGKRLLLRQGLEQSKDQIIQAIEAAPSPTDIIQ
ncbi:hypothetical protein [Salidesulfovibrio onnuriiensis]|uniref:hypothetical protein n=1 Tax=Salidesulfovibrio onnuriiensis TaxID=2583823 RepID=UPI0011C94FA5|nr:hypothetical protein [Salidesulfovibrio onnuriiensis]